MKENSVDHQRGSVAAGIEDFCETFERTVKPVVVSVWRTDFAVSVVNYTILLTLMLCFLVIV